MWLETTCKTIEKQRSKVYTNLHNAQTIKMLWVSFTAVSLTRT